MTKKILSWTALSLLSLAVGFAVRLYNEGGLPTAVLRKAAEQMYSTTSAHYDAIITVSGPANGDSPLVTVTIKGAYHSYRNFPIQSALVPLKWRVLRLLIRPLFAS
jgi:hypothetical protein